MSLRDQDLTLPLIFQQTAPETFQWCAGEPIHTPGAVQTFGVLLALDAKRHIAHSGGCTQDLFGLAPDELIDLSLSQLFPTQELEWLNATIDQLIDGSIHYKDSIFTKAKPQQLLEGQLHQYDSVVIFELHPRQIITPASLAVRTSHLFHQITSQMSLATSLNHFLQSVLDELLSVSGCERLLLYQFDENWHGQVVAEARQPEMAQLLGFYYPAIDIPAQARQMYIKNRVRVLVDAQADPIAITPQHHSETGRPLDLTLALTRAMSPRHREFLNKMGVRATITVSIVRQGQLWGLIIGQHREPYLPCGIIRRCFDSMAYLIAEQINHEAEHDQRRLSKAAQKSIHFLLENLSQEKWIEAKLIHPAAGLLELFQATGIAVIRSRQIWQGGIVPKESDLLILVNWLETHVDRIYATNALGLTYPPLAHLTELACGLLAIRLFDQPNHWLLYFRPENRKVVNWIIDPSLRLQASSRTIYSSPDQSLEQWTQEVRGQAKPWTNAELAVVEKALWPVLNEILLADSMIRNRDLEDHLLLMQAVVENAHEAVLITADEINRPNTPTIVYVNPAFETMTGYHAHDVIGNTPHLLIGPETDRQTLDEIDQTLSTGNPVDVEIINYRKEGIPFWAHLSLFPIKDARHRICNWVGIRRDITQRRQAEQQLRVTNAQYQLLANSMQDVIFLINQAGFGLYISPSCEKVFGHPSSQFLDDRWHEVVHPEDLQRLKKLPAAGQTDLIEWRLQQPDGTWLWIESVTTPYSMKPVL